MSTETNGYRAVCPQCRVGFRVPGSAAGRKSRCPKCGTAFRIPPANEPLTGLPTARPAGRSTMLLVAVGGAMLAVGALAGVGAVALTRSGAKPDTVSSAPTIAPATPAAPAPDLPAAAPLPASPITPTASPPSASVRTADVSDFTNSMGMKFVAVRPGTFLMGAPADEADRLPAEVPHTVTLTRGFAAAAHETTQGEFRRLLGYNPSKSSGDDNLPVENVTWVEAVEFCRRLGDLPAERAAGRSYRLPTEAEWEYACRAGTTTATPFGPRLSAEQANFDGTQPYNGAPPGPNHKRPVRVGSFAPNPWGLHDTLGNVWEWCSDWYADAATGDTDPAGPEAGQLRVYRGGGWKNWGKFIRSANRVGGTPNLGFDSVGFRVVCEQKVADPSHPLAGPWVGEMTGQTGDGKPVTEASSLLFTERGNLLWFYKSKQGRQVAELHRAGQQVAYTDWEGGMYTLTVQQLQAGPRQFECAVVSNFAIFQQTVIPGHSGSIERTDRFTRSFALGEDGSVRAESSRSGGGSVAVNVPGAGVGGSGKDSTRLAGTLRRP